MRRVRELVLVFALVAAGTIPAAMVATSAAYACHWPIDWVIDEQDFTISAGSDWGFATYKGALPGLHAKAYTWGLLLFCQETHTLIIDGRFTVSGVPIVVGELGHKYQSGGLTISSLSPSPCNIHGGVGQNNCGWERVGAPGYGQVHLTRANIPRSQWGTSFTVRVDVVAFGSTGGSGDGITITLNG